ncbi:RIO1 family regulatory kinase/ATPase [Sulfolobus acidocaldarius]|uniref:RIO1 family regulatory kinase/ATPase domain-containing protein n=1 Tax=Sulfolobus acidocaldarius TaxID=2285 RepID=UPI0007833414|nr:RIO1 family regulatory kinase/ATPase [Sulfolobus acidocaldarius]
MDADMKSIDIKYFIYPSYSVSYTHLMCIRDRVIKIRRTDSPKETLKIEAKIQQLAYPVSPKVYLYGENFILMEYIRGRHLTRQENIETIRKILMKARMLELKGIEHKELSRPYKNVLVNEKDAYIIDYDSATIKPNPKNVTSILSWFKRYELAKMYSLGYPLEKIILLL